METIKDFGKYQMLIPANYSNNVELSGLLVEEPTYQEFEYNGKVVTKATILLHQPTRIEKFNTIKDKHLTIETYSKEVVKALKEIKKQCLIVVLGMVSRKKQCANKDNYYYSLGVNVTDLKVARTSDYDLLKGDK